MKTKESLNDKILAHFQSRFRKGKVDPVHSQIIGDWGHSFGYKHETVGRNLRILAEKGLLTAHYVKMKDKKTDTVWYSYIPTQRDLLVQSINEKTKNT